MQNPPGTGSPASASSPKLAALPPATDSIEARSCAMSATRRSSSAAVIGLLAGSRPVPMALLPSLDDRKSMEPRTTSGCRPAGAVGTPLVANSVSQRFDRLAKRLVAGGPRVAQSAPLEDGAVGPDAVDVAERAA